MSKKRPVAAPFEVGRSVYVDPRKNAAFCGAVAGRGFREAWSIRQITAEAGAGMVPHPGLTGYEVPVLRRDEVAAALYLDIDDEGEPVLSLKKAELLAQRLKPICEKSKSVKKIPPASQLVARMDEASQWNIVLPITEEDAGEIALQLQKERAECLDALFDVTGFFPTPNVPVAMGIARFSVGLSIQIHDMRWEAQRALDIAHELGFPDPASGAARPLGQYNLGPAKIWD